MAFKLINTILFRQQNIYLSMYFKASVLENIQLGEMEVKLSSSYNSLTTLEKTAFPM